MSCAKTTFGGIIAVHIGAGYHSPSREAEYREVCSAACTQAIKVINSGGSALDAITEAIKSLENAECTNAGVGCNLTLDGCVECDASIMDGKSLLFGAVGAIPEIKNPILVAKKLIDCQAEESLLLGRIPPCIMVGKGALQWAKDHGIQQELEHNMKTERSLSTYNKYKRKLESLQEWQQAKRRKHLQNLEETAEPQEVSDQTAVQDTVGAVCVDCYGNVAAGVSSGGISLKQPGRLGPAAVYGAGCWAKNSVFLPGVAMATSGTGEHLIRTSLAKECAEHVQRGTLPAEALQCVLQFKFMECEYLKEVPEKLAGALGLKVEKEGSKHLDVELLWGHTTDSFCLGYMSTKHKKPKKKRYKDTLKASLKDFDIPIGSWEQTAQERSKWRGLINKGAALHEKRESVKLKESAENAKPIPMGHQLIQ